MRCSQDIVRHGIAVIVVVALVSCLLAFAGGQRTPGNAFTYQGQLKLAGNPIDGTADVRFSLFDAATSPATQIGATAQFNNLNLVEGFIALNLDFGANAFDGNARWLEIDVRSPAGSGNFTTLSPRQPITPVPYALYALNAPAAGGTTGQSATTTFGTTALGVSQSTINYTLIPGLTQIIDVPENSSVFISADGGVQTTVTANAGGISRADIALFIDGQAVGDGGFKRIYAANTSGVTSNMIANWHMSQSQTLAAGQHTIEIRARYNGGEPCFVSGDTNSPLQGQLTVMILKQ